VQFNVPELRVGTLDSLLALSDDLVKVNTLVEAVAQKIQRQVVELASSESEVSSNCPLPADDLLVSMFPHPLTTQQQSCGTVQHSHIYRYLSASPQIARDLTVDGVSAGRFLTDFAWDEAKHPARRPLRETVDKLQESVAKVDDEFKLKTSEYTSVKSQLNGLTRKAAGSLATRDLGELVQGADVR